MRTYRNQFPSRWHDIPAMFLTDAFRDMSNGNDVSPSFLHVASGATVWVECADPEYRECGGGRFTLTYPNPDADSTEFDWDRSFDTDDLNLILSTLAGIR